MNKLQIQLVHSRGSAIGTIASRARRLFGIPNTVELELALRDLHRGACPLRLTRLARADSFNLAHDVMGILRHYDPATGTLTGGFRPRYALPATPEADVDHGDSDAKRRVVEL
jgi:hypothetical protein